MDLKTYNKGNVIWITGLSGSGKTTIASALVPMLETKGRHVVMLDGDELREVFNAVESNKEHHSREGRLTLAMQYSKLCKLLANQGLTVVIATISLFHEIHEWNRDNLPGYLEVYLKVPLEELRLRDPKGIYKRFDKGELINVAGLDLTVDQPSNPDIKLVYDVKLGVSQSAEKIMNLLINEYY